jgi:hypothetical protein
MENRDRRRTGATGTGKDHSGAGIWAAVGLQHSRERSTRPISNPVCGLGIWLFMPLTHTDRVREYARREYIDPARSRRQSTVRVVAGEVQKAVRLTNRVPLVCQALKID